MNTNNHIIIQTPGSLTNVHSTIDEPSSRWKTALALAHMYPITRNLELKLLIWVIVTILISYTGLIKTFHRQFNIEILLGPICFIALCALLHFAFRLFAPFSDPVILPITLMLNGLGLIILLRIDYDGLSTEDFYGSQSSFALRQLYWLGWSVIVAIIVLFKCTNHRSLARYAYASGIVGIVFLLIPSILPNKFSTVNGAKIWIFTRNFSIQPVEIAKIFLIIFASGLLVIKRDLFTSADKKILGITFPKARDIWPLFLAASIAITVLILEKDLGVSLLIYITILIMTYVASEKSIWLVLGVVIFLCATLICYLSFSYLHTKIDIWLHPFSNPHSTGYQSVQALFGLGTGGVAGTGLGYGRPTIVPFSFSDFIIASLGEELGQIGLTAILILYLILILRIIYTGINVRDSFGKLLCCGIGSLFFVQIILVIGGITHILPLSSLTTPFLSYGGSSLIGSHILIAILARISSDSREPAGLITDPGRLVAYSVTEMLEKR